MYHLMMQGLVPTLAKELTQGINKLSNCFAEMLRIRYPDFLSRLLTNIGIPQFRSVIVFIRKGPRSSADLVGDKS